MTGIHALLAAGMAAPELELTEAEAETVAKNIAAVARHYDLQATARAQDWGNLVVSLGIVYGGRIVRISSRKTAERQARRASVAGVGAVGAAVAPNPAPPPNGQAGPAVIKGSRPKTDADLALLNEHEVYIS